MTDGAPVRLELTVELDPHAVEALRLEIRRLAQARGLDVERVEASRSVPPSA